MSIIYLKLLFVCLLPYLILSSHIDIEFHHETFNDSHPDAETFGRHLVTEDEIEITLSDYDRLMVQLCIGKNNQCLRAKLTSSSPYVWVVNKEVFEQGYNPSESGAVDTGKTLSIAELYGYVKGPIYQDTVKIGKYKVDNFSFLVTNTKEFKYGEYQGAIGFGYLYDNNEFSFLDKLHESLEIDNQRFYVKYTGEKKGIIRLGEYPEEVVNDSYGYSFKQCDLIPTRIENDVPVPNNRWECALKGIYYSTFNGEIKYILTNDRVQFSLGSNINSFPAEVFSQFITQYMQKYLDSGDCYIDSMKYLDVVYCKKDFNYEQLGDINYILGKWSLKFEAKDLFSVLNDKLRFGIYGHKGKKFFLLGYYLFKKYIVVFDKYRKKMGMYLKN